MGFEKKGAITIDAVILLVLVILYTLIKVMI